MALPIAIFAQRQPAKLQPGVLAHCREIKPPPERRVLGLMPNFRTVPPGAHPPPPTPAQALKMATRSSFDYSAFLFAAITSAVAEVGNPNPQIGTNPADYWGYYWRGFLDKTDGNYLVMFALPAVFHQDERYYSMGSGSIWKRTLYAATRVFVTPNYHGRNSLNFSELLGRAAATRISTTYYPRQDRRAGELATRYGYAIMRDSLTNIFVEFWPDIATHVLHLH